MKQNVIISGGGTGGHIYPGLAIAEQLKISHPELEVHFVGAKGGLEESIIPKYDYPLHCLNVGRLHPSVPKSQRILSLLLLPISFFQALWLIIRYRPRWVLGIGGFASGPMVFVASLCRVKTAFLEPNAFPGMTNRYLSKWVHKCFVVFADAGKSFPQEKVEVVGLPVRLNKRPPKTDLWAQRPMRILIFGGSQGSRAINRVVADWVESLGGQGSQYEVVHQIGRRDFSQWSERYQDKHKAYLTYLEYIDDMPERLDWADLIICRAGIGSVAEVAMASRAAIFVPLPTAADNHQFKNAEVLVNKEAAFMIEEKDFNWQALHSLVTDLRNEPSRIVKIMNNLVNIDYSLAPSDIINRLENH
jgi:UDP-N-acetylglucosamine--N-acetylmuramyl-(pentapeptide) pyrophosphoryl-undecaprenol N-acetylglucosamine transferase